MTYKRTKTPPAVSGPNSDARPFHLLISHTKPGTANGKAQAKDKTMSKQATLFSLKGAPSKATTAVEVDLPQEVDLEDAPVVPLAALVSTGVEINETSATEPELEETQLEETQVEETPQIPIEEPAAMEDDDEPLEWEESDREDEPVKDA